MSQWGCQPERGFLLPLGLGSLLDVVCPFSRSFSDLVVGDAGMVENRPDAPRQVGQVRAARSNCSPGGGGPYSLTFMPSCSKWMCSSEAHGRQTLSQGCLV